MNSKIIVALLFSFQFTIAQNWRFNIHDPSNIIKDGEKYWIYGTGDGIHAAYSHDLIAWTNSTTPYTSTEYPRWLDAYIPAANSEGAPKFHGNFWAPDIVYMNGKYHLYYSASIWATMTSIVGGTTNVTLDPQDPRYNWEDLGFMDIWSYQPGLALNAIDPSIMRGHDGKVWMIYGSFNKEGIVITELDTLTGKPKDYPGNLPGISIANSWTGPNAQDYAEGEGAAGFYHDGYYYLFYSKGGCCAGVNSTYYVVMGRSPSPTGPYVDKDGKKLKINGAPSGGTVVMKHRTELGDDDRYYGPGHLGFFTENGVHYVSFHYYDPNWPYPNQRAGGPSLGLARIAWEDDGWPRIALDFVPSDTYVLKNLHSNKFLSVENHQVQSQAKLWQYELDSIRTSQQWILTSLGYGEYSIKNAANPDLYVESINNETLQLTANYTGASHQKFRLTLGADQQAIIFPSTSDNLWEIPNAAVADAPVKLWPHTNHPCQRWELTLASNLEPPTTLNLLQKPKTATNASSGKVRLLDLLGRKIRQIKP